MFTHEKIIKFLDLPSLDDATTQEILTLAEKIQPDLSSVTWLENFHKKTLKAASEIYARDSAVIPIYIQDKIKKLYQPYFSTPITPIFGVFENIYKDDWSQIPPHCDRQRKLAINYIVETGGLNVLTCFYNNTRIGENLESAECAIHDKLSLNCKVRLPDRVWHAYCVQTYHSVENIKTKRIILSLYLQDNISYNDFIKLHNHLLYE